MAMRLYGSEALRSSRARVLTFSSFISPTDGIGDEGVKAHLRGAWQRPGEPLDAKFVVRVRARGSRRATSPSFGVDAVAEPGQPLPDAPPEPVALGLGKVDGAQHGEVLGADALVVAGGVQHADLRALLGLAEANEHAAERKPKRNAPLHEFLARANFEFRILVREASGK